MPREKMSNVQLTNSYTSSTWKKCVKQGVYSGLIAGVASYTLLGEVGEMEVLGRSVMASTGVGASVFVASIIADNITDPIVGSIDPNSQFRAVESSLMKDAVCGLATVGSLKVISGIDPSVTAFLTGGVSKFAGDSLFQMYDPVLLGALF